MPNAASTFGIHADTSGATNELPAPVSDPADDPSAGSGGEHERRTECG